LWTLSSMGVAIQVEGIGKRYRIGVQEDSHDTLARQAMSVVTAPLRNFKKYRSLYKFKQEEQIGNDIIWALKDVSFNIGQGEVMGIIGRNGAGKSTLLKIISRITNPTRGQVVIRGRVAALLEVATGFHPELTGRENVYLNGTILGMRKKEIDTNFEEIIEFAEVSKFIDTPIKRYSSGMIVRLAFSVAAHLEPEILLVDEVLAVGDIEFQRKSLGKMDDVSKSGRTVLFVSHNMGHIARLCHRTVLLNDGRVQEVGPTKEVISTYTRNIYQDVGPTREWNEGEGGETDNLKLQAAWLSDSSGEVNSYYAMTDPIGLNVKYEVKRDGLDVNAVWNLYNEDGIQMFSSYNYNDNESNRLTHKRGVYQTTARIPADLLNSGNYTLSFQLNLSKSISEVYQDGCLSFEVVDNKRYPGVAKKRLHQKIAGVIHPDLSWKTR
jgi:lipopolysaccharide transport system ATP-binding protein